MSGGQTQTVTLDFTSKKLFPVSHLKMSDEGNVDTKLFRLKF